MDILDILLKPPQPLMGLFSSFDLAQGYLQMAMEEADIRKTAFHTDSSGLYEFTHMPFGLTNTGTSFCHLMEMCIGDQ